jgi:chromosome segregation ATPase
MEQTLDQQQLHWEAERSRYNSEIAGLTERNNNQMLLIEKLDADITEIKADRDRILNDLADFKLCNETDSKMAQLHSVIAELTQCNETQQQRINSDILALNEMTNQRDALQARLDTVQETVKSLYSDAQIISDELLSEAESRDWCSEYDRFVDRVNGRLSRIELQQRIRNYEVSMTATVTFRVQVEATDEDGALEYANDMSIDLPSSYGSMYDIDITDLTADEANLA